MKTTTNRPEYCTNAEKKLPNCYGEFVLWEKSTSGVKLRKEIVDVVGDLTAAILLNQVLYWYLPAKNGRPRLRVHKEGEYWLAKSRQDWWKECRLTVRQVDRAMQVLESKNLLKKSVFKFGKTPVQHIAVNLENLLALLHSQPVSTTPEQVTPEAHEDCTSERVDCDKSVKSLTESTGCKENSENTTEEADLIPSCLFEDQKAEPVEKQPSIPVAAADLISGFLHRWGQQFPQLQVSGETKLVEDLALVGSNLNFPLDCFFAIAFKLAEKGQYDSFSDFCSTAKRYMPEYIRALRLLNQPPSMGADRLSSRLASFFVGWKDDYEAFFSKPYVITDKDGEVAGNCCISSPSFSAKELLSVAITCWEWDRKYKAKPGKYDGIWHARRAVTMAWLLKYLAKIKSQLDWDNLADE